MAQSTVVGQENPSVKNTSVDAPQWAASGRTLDTPWTTRGHETVLSFLPFFSAFESVRESRGYAIE